MADKAICKSCGHPIDFDEAREFMDMNPDLAKHLGIGIIGGGDDARHSNSWQCVYARLRHEYRPVIPAP